LKSPAPLRALVLCAGRGERLRPLTDALPKPLIPVLGAPLVSHTLGVLAAAGVQAAALNLHHLGDRIPAALGERAGSMKLRYSVEEELLGTLGPFGRLREFFAGVDPVLLVNGDSLCRWPVAAVSAAHREGGAEATLLLSSRPEPARFGGGVVVDRGGRVLSFRGEGAGTEGTRVGVFAGLHVIAGRQLDGIEERPSDIVRDLYEPLLERGGAVRAVFTDRRWYDLGTPRRYLAGALAQAAAEPGAGSSWYGPGVEVEEGARVDGSVLESGVRVAAGATIENSLVLPGVLVGREAQVKDSILAPGVELPVGARAISSLVSHAGELVAQPMGNEE
jgi:NDP-sugar pyrophosphorylase family protein